VPRTCRCVDNTVFSVAASQAWNRPPTELKQLRSTASLRQKLKTYLFYLPDLWMFNFVMHNQSNSRGRIINTAVTVTVTEDFFKCVSVCLPPQRCKKLRRKAQARRTIICTTLSAYLMFILYLQCMHRHISIWFLLSTVLCTIRTATRLRSVQSVSAVESTKSRRE